MSQRKFLFTYTYECTHPEYALDAEDTDDAEANAIAAIIDSLSALGLGDGLWEIAPDEADGEDA